MTRHSAPTRRAALAAVVACLAAGLTGCGGGDDTPAGSTTSAGPGAFQLWDPYPQFDETSDWTKLVQQCGTDAGVKVTRTGYDTTALTGKVLLAAQQGVSPTW